MFLFLVSNTARGLLSWNYFVLTVYIFIMLLCGILTTKLHYVDL